MYDVAHEVNVGLFSLRLEKVVHGESNATTGYRFRALFVPDLARSKHVLHN
jgi:hypothetical protein